MSLRTTSNSMYCHKLESDTWEHTSTRRDSNNSLCRCVVKLRDQELPTVLQYFRTPSFFSSFGPAIPKRVCLIVCILVVALLLFLLVAAFPAGHVLV